MFTLEKMLLFVAGEVENVNRISISYLKVPSLMQCDFVLLKRENEGEKKEDERR